MVEEIKLRVEPVLVEILQRLQDGLHEALTNRPGWAADVATSDELKQVAGVMTEVVALAKSASTAVAMDGIKGAIEALPTEAASPKAIAQVITALLELTSNIERLGATATSEVAAGRAQVEGLSDCLLRIEQVQQELLVRLEKLSGDMQVIAETTNLNQQLLMALARPWYRRIFS